MTPLIKLSLLPVLVLALACESTPAQKPDKTTATVEATKSDTAPSKSPEAPQPTPKTEPNAGSNTAPTNHTAMGDHAHESPHGGKVATSGDKHLELKMNEEGHIDVFVLDENTKPTSSKNAQGKVKLTLPDGIKEFPLSYDEKGDHLTAMAPKITAKKVVALVDLTINGKPHSARFDYEFGAHSH